MAEQTVILLPGESKIVSFEATPPEAKTYQVLIDGLTGSFVATVAPVASLRGTVIDSEEHEPVVDRLVVALTDYEGYKAGRGLRTDTDNTGTFRFYDLPLGPCDLWICDWPYPMHRQPALVEGLNVVGPYILRG